MTDTFANTSPESNAGLNRRAGTDRRRRRTFPLHLSSWWGGRRHRGRRHGETGGRYVDRYDPRYRMMAIGLMLLSALDAFFTMTLLSLGSEELNPVMGWLLAGNTDTFFYGKMGITALGVLLLVPHHDFMWLRVIPVRFLLQAFCAVYGALVVYETSMLIFVGTFSAT